jgi:hypothetical protein
MRSPAAATVLAPATPALLATPAALATLATLAVLVPFAGCAAFTNPCFTPDSEVVGLQVLAIRADPPDAELLADGSAPAVQVRALVVDPSSGGAIVVHASACAPSADKRCSTADLAPPSRGDPGEHTFAALRAPAEVIRQSLAEDPLAGYGGIRVQLQLEALGNGKRATGEKLLLFARPGEGRALNKAFEIAGLRVRRFTHLYHENGGPPPPDDQTLVPGQALILDVGDPVWLQPVLAPGALEEYETRDLAGRTVRLREQVTYSFYNSPHAVLGESSSSEPQPDGPQPLRGLTEMTYLRVGGGTGTLWVVARDSRGAQAFLQVPFFAGDRRGCWITGGRCALFEFGCF